ncbi:MAG: cytochrome c [Lewinellaceae bacterium]|nr:cytochrome c [Lewinellaceae bacterium]
MLFSKKGILLPLIACLLALVQCESNPYREGERLYKMNCANCHLDDGAGLGALIPPLAGADYLAAHRERLPCILKYGLKDTIVVNGTVYAEAMPGVQTLSAIQIANILNYINTNWGNNLPPYRLDEVRALLEDCE